MDEHEMEQALMDLLSNAYEATNCPDPGDLLPEELEGLDGVETFRQAGILTNNAGLVIRMQDRSEWQITIVRSR